MTKKNTPKPASTKKLDNLKKEAKRWLKALRANDEAARVRLSRVYPEAPQEPKLRYIQHALALERGFTGWSALKKQLEDQSADNQLERELSGNQLDDLVNQFLEYACSDPILCNGPAAHARRARAALRMLKRYPQIARHNIHTAVVCGDLEEVERILKQRPEAATEPGGPQRRRHLPAREKLWTPLLHLCYGRLQIPAAADNAAAIARSLLDAGADPNDYFEVGSHPCRYTALCGIAGEGEDDGPPHPQKEAIARLLLERGAEPYDIQLFYNTHFHADILWVMELIHEFSIESGRQADWDDPNWSMIDMGGYDFGARYFLLNAIRHNNLKLAEWLLAHGANPNASQKPQSKFPKRSLYQEAVGLGFTEMADLLVRYGATPVQVALNGISAFTAACFRLDREEALAHLAEHPDYLHSHVPIFAAARRDRADVVEFLLDLGVPIEIEDDTRQRPLHEAASHDSINVAKLLIERGADLEAVETNWNNTPLDHALYGNLHRMIKFLSGYTRDVFRLTWIGNLERLREVLDEEPQLAKLVDENNTPLMWIPDDEGRARQIVELLVAHGADPTIKNKEGMTAADLAERRAMYDVAELLRSLERRSL
ncbi:MAG TPA: ankyrin repeat domain-containing protein [Blastocatellia bacterium]|nr:ankyrin repeat domain-containing protein [Blastocatellia bacterium]